MYKIKKKYFLFFFTYKMADITTKPSEENDMKQY